MLAWLEALIIGASASILLIIITILVYFLIRRRFSPGVINTTANHSSTPPPTKTPPFQPTTTKRPPSYPLFRSTKQVFNWDDHPSSIIDAVENGWSRFAFTNYTLRSSLLRVTGDNNNNQVEFSWEVGQESSDFMQKIQFHKLINGGNTATSSSSIRMVLPLPGPPPSFPQEAYFEIKVLKLGDNNNNNDDVISDNECSKLMLEKNYSSSLSLTTGNNKSTSRGAHVLKEIKLGGGRRGGEGVIKMSVGLTGGGSPASGSKLLGSYQGSVGFNSDGSVFLAGMKLSSKSEKQDWAQAGKVIGCGFNPTQKKVFFTVDSEIIHVINCKSDDFGMPLYPILTANHIDVTLLVNLGQSPFSFSPANAQRTPNPCFIGPKIDSSEVEFGYEDSRELFSMGRIDAEWLSHNATVRSTASYEESEVDLFELVLDSVGRSSVNERSARK